jgi:hypothetical protein
MPIELHCPSCEKLIRAPDNAGGRHGKCPYCEAKVYIPLPPSAEDEISIAPLDESDAEAERLRREAIRYAANVDKEPDSADRGEPGAPRGGTRPGPAAAPGEVIDLGDHVEQFVLAMKASKLDEADKIAARLKRAGSRAKDYVEGLMLDPTPPPIEGVPKPLVMGFLKALLERL